jgi:hypothetical protein
VFFVFFGLQINPAQIHGVLPLAVGLAVGTAATKIATGWWASARAGIGRRGRLRAGVALIPRGEFSIIIAGLTTTAASAGLIPLDHRFGPLAAAYVLLLAVTGPLLARLLEARASHHRPHPTVISASAGGPEKLAPAHHHHEMAQRTGAHTHPDPQSSNGRQRTRTRLVMRLRREQLYDDEPRDMDK